MEACVNIESFKKAAERQKNISIAPYLFEEMNRDIVDNEPYEKKIIRFQMTN